MRKQSAFKEGFAFHRVAHPLTGADTDVIKGLVVQHPGDRYRWRHIVDNPMETGAKLLVHFPSLSCLLCGGQHYDIHHDLYITERQNNIGKWNLCLGKIHRINAGGVAVLTRDPSILVRCIATHPSGRLIVAEVSRPGLTLVLLAAYFPADATTRCSFLTNVIGPAIDQIQSNAHVVLIGDLNTVEDPTLDRTSQTGTPLENDRLIARCSRFQLSDSFRTLHPKKREFTFYSASSDSSSRIDRALISCSLLPHLEVAAHTMPEEHISDHGFAIKIAFKTRATTHLGPGIWRLHAAAIGRPGVRKAVEAALTKAAENGVEDFQLLLGRLNAGLRSYMKEEGKRIKRTTAHLVDVVAELRQEQMRSPGCQRTRDLLLVRETQLHEYHAAKRDRLHLMAGTNTELAGEVPSPFLSARVKVRKQRTQIAELTVGGTTVPDAQGILKAATQYYTDLFGADGRTSSERWKPLPGKRLNAEAAEMLEADWTEQEVKQAFKALANNKSPGKDGLPKELFKRNWDILGGEFLRMAHNFSDTASIPASIKEAVTILLHKKGDKDKLDNYRPITLLNFTYKVLARVVANRMRSLLHRVISEEQYGFIPGRRISDAIGVVADVIEAAKKGDEDWYLLLVDFRKAFDSVSRSFIFTVLREMGFPERFVGWVEGLHRETKTRLLVNGWLGEAVDVKSGVRQGCPLAPYLFLCAVEPLAQEACRRKLGLCNKAGQRLVYLGYADDTTLFLEGKRQIARAEKLLDYFAQLSGLATNRDKSVVMPLGHNLGRRPGTLGGFKWAKADEAERLLGVWVTPSGSSAPTWQRAFEKITVELIKWKALFLTIAARVVIINCYITSRIAYQAQVYPPPENVWKQLLKLMHNFLSGNNASADGSYFLWSWDLLSTPRVDGGLGVLDPDILLACLAARRIGGLLLEGSGKKKEVMLTAAGLPMGNDTFVAHEKLLKHWPGDEERWKQTCEVFLMSPLAVIGGALNKEEVAHERLVFNRNILLNGTNPIGGQQAAKGLWETRLGDLVTTDSSGVAAVKDMDILERELRGKESARLALKALAAAPPDWKNLLVPGSAQGAGGVSGAVSPRGEGSAVTSIFRSLPPLPPLPAPPCLPCVEGRQRAAPHSSSFPLTSAPLQTLHMDVWGPARVSGQSRERYFMLVVDNYTRYTIVFPLRSKGEVSAVLIPLIRTVRLQLRERFGHDLPVLHLHSDRGGDFSSDLLRDFCRGKGITQSFTLPDSPQQNGIAERRIGLVMEVARTSMIHAAAPHFLWPFAVRYAAHQLNLWPRVSLPETSSTLRWTGTVGDASVFRVWGSRAFVRDTSADKLSARAIPCVFVGFVPDTPGWRFYHPTSCRVLPSQDVTFDESVPFYRLFPYRSAPPPPPPLFLAPGPPPVDPLQPQGPAPSGVSHVDPLLGLAPVQVAVVSGAAPGTASGGAGSGGAEPGGAGSEGAGSGGAEPEGVEPRGAELEGAEPGGPAGASPRLSSHQLREWLVQRAHSRSGAPAAGEPGDAGAGGATITTRAGDPKEPGAAGAGGAGAGVAGVGGLGAGGAGAAGAGAVDPGAGGAGGTVRPCPYFVPLLQQVLGVPSSTSLPPPFLCPPPDQSQPPLQPASPLPVPSPYTEQSRGLTEHREPASRPVLPVRTARHAPRLRPPPVLGTHTMALRPSSVPLRVPLPPPPESSLPAVRDPESDRARAASPTVTRLLTTAVTDPSFESTAASALVAEPLDFAAACRLDYASALVAESVPASPPPVGGECALGTDVLEDRQGDFECLAATVPRFASMVLAPKGDPDTPDIPTPRSYAEAIEGPYSSQWQAAMDAEMASWKSTGTYVDEVLPPGVNIVDGMWIFRVKRPPGSSPTFKARYVARGFSQRQGVDYFQTFSPTPKMTTLWVLLHVAAQRDYELHPLDFKTTFLQGSLHEEIWLHRPPGFTGTTTLAALGFAPSTADPSLFLRTNTLLPPFYVLVYVDDLVFATADTEALTFVKFELQKRHTCTDLGELHSYLGLQITRDRARCTISLTQSHMVHQVLQRFGFQYSSPQLTPLSASHLLSAPTSDESVEPSGPYPELVGCLMYLMTCSRPDLAYPLSLLARYVAPGRHRKVHWDAAKRVLRYLCSTLGMGLVLGGRGPVVLTGHADASWVDDSATQRSSQGYTFSLGFGSVSWRSTRSSSILSSSCEAEIYTGAMASQELRWLIYLLTDLGEQPRSPPVLYVDNKAMIALCQEHRLEHRTKHIALRYFLARELQQRGQLRLAYVATWANTANVLTKGTSAW
ncbi:unnamed protein product [Closterium sp. NIES-54]